MRRSSVAAREALVERPARRPDSPAGCGQRGELVGVADGRVVDGAPHDLVERLRRQVGRVGVAHRAVAEDAHAHAAALRRGELLDLAAIDLDAAREARSA